MSDMALISNANAQYGAATARGGMESAKRAMAAGGPKDMVRMRKIAQDFESMFLTQMM